MADQTSDISPSGSQQLETLSVITPPSSSKESDRQNEILAQVQERLKKQLLDRKNELQDRIYEQKRQLLRATRDREEAGVQLYDLQCNLSSLHASLNKTTTALMTTTQGHAKVKQLYYSFGF